MKLKSTNSEAESIGYLARAQRRILTEATKGLFTRPLAVRPTLPLVSFTFDDFPRTALLEGGSILTRNGALGTYYISMSLMGKGSHLGPMFEMEDLKEIIRLGHELGCHTYGHCHSWDTPPDVYENAIVENRRMLAQELPGITFQTFSYPYSAPSPGVKKVARQHFLCCRGGGMRPGRYTHRHTGGGQTFNSGITDLNYLCAFFLEKSRDNCQAIKTLIDQNARAHGWLIFATHDICESPSPYGCTPEFFEQVVQWTLESGARILPVVQALEELGAMQPKEKV